MRLENKIAIITGSASGIGRETAILFSKEGASVVVADMDENRGEKTVKEVKEIGGEGFFIKVDVSNRQQTRNMVKDSLEKYGKIDVLINNAGIAQDALLTKMTEKQWNKVIDVNLKGVFNCIQSVAEVMVAQKQGVIINTSSIVGLYGNIGQANYAAAKAGIIGITKALAKELGSKGVRVNAVAPGFIVTPMIASVPAKIIETIKERTPLRRLGEPKDVAFAYLYLASDEATFVNGSVLSVDGGLTI